MLKGCYMGSGLNMNWMEQLLPVVKARRRSGSLPVLLCGFLASFLCQSEINDPVVCCPNPVQICLAMRVWVLK